MIYDYGKVLYRKIDKLAGIVYFIITVLALFPIWAMVFLVFEAKQYFERGQ